MSIKKKAKGKDKGAAKKTAKTRTRATRTTRTKKGKDIVEVRKSIDALVVDSAQEIAVGAITAAKAGQLATAKYLFEAVGLYPPTEQTAAPVPLKDTLAHTLLTRMGIPTEPVNREDDDEVAVPASDAKCVKTATAAAGGGNEPGAEREDEPDPGDSVQ